MRAVARLSMAVLLAGATCVVGCGENGRDRSGELTVLVAGDFDSIDPGLAGLPTSNQVLTSVHRRLYSAFPGGREGIEADLAAGPPRVSDRGRTVTVELRDGVRFAPPVNRVITADDIRYGIERIFLPGLQGFATTVFGDLVGAQEALNDGRGWIAGIETPTRRRVVFRLQRPVAGAFIQQALTFAHPVPREYAAQYDRSNQSQYFRHQVATGPYRFAADASGVIGEEGYDPGVGALLVRNPNWDSSTDFRPAHIDRIRFRLGNDDPDLVVRRIQADRALAAAGVDVPPARLRDLTSVERDELLTPAVMSSLVALWLNTSAPPFDDPQVRRAVLAGFDRRSALQTLGGPLAGAVATHLLAPAVGGHEESGGRRGMGLEVLSDPDGDDALARRLLADAPRDRPRAVTLVAPTGMERLGEVAQEELSQLGFEVRLRIVSSETLVSVCGGPQTVETCLSSFVMAVPDPGVFFATQLSGVAAAQPVTFNFSRLADPRLDAVIAAAAATADDDARNRRWAWANRLALQLAAGVPLVWPLKQVAHSRDVRAVVQVDLDYSATALDE